MREPALLGSYQNGPRFGQTTLSQVQGQKERPQNKSFKTATTAESKKNCHDIAEPNASGVKPADLSLMTTCAYYLLAASQRCSRNPSVIIWLSTELGWTPHRAIHHSLFVRLGSRGSVLCRSLKQLADSSTGSAQEGRKEFVGCWTLNAEPIAWFYFQYSYAKSCRHEKESLESEFQATGSSIPRNPVNVIFDHF